MYWKYFFSAYQCEPDTLTSYAQLLSHLLMRLILLLFSLRIVAYHLCRLFLIRVQPFRRLISDEVIMVFSEKKKEKCNESMEAMANFDHFIVY